jgi:hypothetical protein
MSSFRSTVTYQKSRLKYWHALARDRWLPGSDRRAPWQAPANVFFVTGHGRSGTQFLAHLLDEAANAVVAHEPVEADIFAVQRARLEPRFAARYVADYRRWRIAEAAARAAPGVYGEVNSRLRSLLPALKESFPEAPMLRIIRDGRDVVRSMMARDRWMIDILAKRAPELAPSDPFVGEVGRMSEFERACWYWQFDTARLARLMPGYLRFEDLMRDPDHVLERLVRPFGLELERAAITAALGRPRNETRRHALPDWQSWSAAETESFWRICGDVMREHGYER